MQEVIQPDRLRDMDSAAGNGLHLTPAEQQTGSTTAESQQHLNVDTAEYQGKDEQKKKKSALGKVKEKAKKLKSKVKKGLKIGGSDENEEPSDEDSSQESQDDDEDQNATAQQSGTNLEKNHFHHTLEQNPEFKGEGSCDEEVASSISDLVEDGKKPITPFKSDGPRHALQAVPTQYRDYYHNPDNDCNGVDSGERKEGEQSHQASAKDGSDLSKSFLGAINDDQYPHGGVSGAKSGSEEVQVEKLNTSQSADLGNEDSAIDEKNDPHGGDKSKRGSLSSEDPEATEGTELEDHGSKKLASSSADLDPHPEVAHSAPTSEEENSKTVGTLEGKVLPKFEAALCKEENQKPSFVSVAQAEEDDVDEENKYAAGGSLEEKVLPKFEAALSRKENQRGSGRPDSELKPSGDGKRSDCPLEKQTSEAGDAFGIGQQTSSSTASDQENNAIPLSQRAFGGLSSVKDSLLDSTYTVTEAVGSTVGYYSHPDSRHDQLPEADRGFSQEKQDPTTNFRVDSFEGGKESSWGEWVSDSITPARELLGSTFGTNAQNEEDGKKHLSSDTKAETQNPLKDGDFEKYEESGVGEDGSKPEEPLISADSKSLPQVLAFPSKGPEAKASTGKSNANISGAEYDSSSQEEIKEA